MAARAAFREKTVALRTDRAVGLWLLAIAAMIGMMVVVGGLTRLTGSGLSITEWQPVTGAIPPLSEGEWQAEFLKYRGTSQYELLNRGMGLAGFKAIFWWEWTHRFLGRLIGFVFALPFVYFLAKGRISRGLAIRLGVIFLLGAAQGVLGWWMVQSGLQPSRIAVSQYRLAAHLGLAIVLFGYVAWTAFEILGLRQTMTTIGKRYRPWTIVLALLILLQMLLGAFMSGLDAGHAFADWPTYGGHWIPPGLYDLSPWWMNHFENHAMVHFQHRNVGYLVLIAALWLYITLKRAGADKPLRMAAIHVVVVTLIQIVLGILTVVTGVNLVLAALHQICALALFTCALWLIYCASAVRLPAPTNGNAGERTSA